MRILIAYAGRNGSTRTCVERLVGALGHLDVTVKDLNTEQVQAAEYDLCVVGGCVRFGRLQPSLRRFFKTQEQALLERPLVLFFCCGLTHESEYYQEVLFPKCLREHAFENVYFGGSLRTDGLPWMDKLLVKALRSSIAESDIEDGEYTPSMPGILPENVDRVAASIRRETAQRK
ncbi:MAG: hypothetical protein IJX28_06045 [Clostridia bacterium]|nr:hypothetical protein [Clostridia bacterium]